MGKEVEAVPIAICDGAQLRVPGTVVDAVVHFGFHVAREGSVREFHFAVSQQVDPGAVRDRVDLGEHFGCSHSLRS